MGRASDGDGAPPLLDPSEFPSLTARGHGEQPHHHIPPPGSKPYGNYRRPTVVRARVLGLGPDRSVPFSVGMVKQPTAEQNEFTMSSEDFPALPGTSGGNAPGVGVIGGGTNAPVGSCPPPSETVNSVNMAPTAPVPALQQPLISDVANEKNRQGVQTSPDGKAAIFSTVCIRSSIPSVPGEVTNIPPTMVPNQYGIIGLLTFIRAAESEPELVSLALGQDLTTLGLNLNSPDNLYLTFAGPWSEVPCR